MVRPIQWICEEALLYLSVEIGLWLELGKSPGCEVILDESGGQLCRRTISYNLMRAIPL